jgi:predicted transcriptional regulator
MKKTLSTSSLKNSSENYLKKFGNNILIAIKRRGLKRSEVADMAFISEPTLRNIIKGDPKVGMGCYLSVLSVMELDSEIARLANPSDDKVGMALEERNLPKRIKDKKKKYEF